MAEQNMYEAECCEEHLIHNELLQKVDGKMPDEQEISDLSDLFKVFGDATRLRILFVLFESEMCVCDLAEVLNMTQSAISHQLKVLKQSKLVTNGVRGNPFFIRLPTAMCAALSHRGATILKKI